MQKTITDLIGIHGFRVGARNKNYLVVDLEYYAKEKIEESDGDEKEQWIRMHVSLSTIYHERVSRQLECDASCMFCGEEYSCKGIAG